MAGAQEQSGLREPADGTPKVRAINRKHLKRFSVHVADPASDVRRSPVRCAPDRVSIVGQASLAGRKLLEVSKGNPRIVTWSSTSRDGREQITQDGNGQNRADYAVAQDSNLHENFPPGDSAREAHLISPVAFAVVENGWPGNLGRWDASHATTSEISCAVIGLPETSFCQSGGPRSGRPAITMVRNS